MATRPKSEAKSKPTDTRGKIVDALMELAAERRFEDISIRDICKAAGVTLADFRDTFPSKGAVLAGFSRRIDRAVLEQDTGELADESPRERLFDILMRRLEAMAPYREGLREATAWLRRTPAAALAMNQAVMNSMRFMLEAAGIEAQGAGGAVKLQGLALAWARVFTSGSTTKTRPVEDDGGTRPRAHARRAGGRGRRPAERAGEPVDCVCEAVGRRARRGGGREARKDGPRRRGRDHALERPIRRSIWPDRSS